MPSFASRADRLLGGTAFALHAVVILAGPWIFGAWETWFFWPLAALMFTAFAFSGLRLALEAASAPSSAGGVAPDAPPITSLRATRCVTAPALAALPFLIYCTVRYLQTPVHADAERQFLLILMPALICAQVLLCFTPAMCRRIFTLVALNLLLLGVYGIVNHVRTGSRIVMWLPGFPQYYMENRASGSYFCPDHFAGIMEFASAVGIALILGRRLSPAARAGGLLVAAVGVAGVALSKSRGGGLAMVALALAVALWGFQGWPRAARRWLRIASLCAATGVAVIALMLLPGYAKRYLDTVGWTASRGKPAPEALTIAKDHIRLNVRARMIAAALRGWETSPWTGIGPGMHKNLWPHIAPTPDGDRASGRRPSLLNNEFHSYEVHCDWIQVLEELGVIGFALFLPPAFLIPLLLIRELRRRSAEAERRIPAAGHGPDPHVLAALLCWVAMAVHSLTDFNLQMPATNWLFATLIAVGLASVTRRQAPDAAPAPGGQAASARAPGEP